MVSEVYEDPVFSKASRVTSLNVGNVQADGFAPQVQEDPGKMGETVERLIDPTDPPKMSQHSEQGGGKAHRYEGKQEGQTFHSTGRTGRWWPVCVVCRTKKGWWTICWYQLLDGSWVVEFWWYADIHVHLMDAIN